MKNILVLSTTNSVENAENISLALVEAKLAACVNILNNVKSIYSWENKIVKDEEILLIIKSNSSKFKALRDLILKLHPYSTPEIISIEINDGNKAYLDWVNNWLKVLP